MLLYAVFSTIRDLPSNIHKENTNTKNHHHHHVGAYIHPPASGINPFGMLRDMLDRKLAEQGKPGLVKIGRWYPSSQLCSDCGYRYEGTKDLGVREWVCPECGAWHDRDVNAAKNIRDEGRRLLLQQ